MSQFQLQDAGRKVYVIGPRVLAVNNSNCESLTIHSNYIFTPLATWILISTRLIATNRAASSVGTKGTIPVWNGPKHREPSSRSKAESKKKEKKDEKKAMS